MNPTQTTTFARPSTRFALAALLTITACTPKQDPLDPDQCPDINYNLTAIKDAQYVATYPAIDVEVTSRMAGKFPGVGLAVIANGEIVYLKGYGVADRNLPNVAFDDEPVTNSTVFGIGSVSKVLTSVAVMKLAEMNRVDLDAPIALYFPYATPAGWNQVTVRQLLAHRGGFARDPDSALAGALTAAQVDATFGMQKASQHPRYGMWEFLLTTRGRPVIANIGQYQYSNIGYVILGALVDHVTLAANFPGGPFGYERFVWSLVAGQSPAALTAALDHPWRSSDILGLAQSYSAAWNPMNTNYSGWQSACGGWSLTASDMARVMLSLTGNTLLSGASLTQMRTNPGPGVGSDDYGLGLFLAPRAGRTAWSHGGLIDGFRSQITYWPNEKVGVVVFANRDTQGVGAIGDAVGTLWMSGKAKPAAPDRNQQARMATVTYALSRDHFPFLENFVRGQIKRYGERGAGDWLIRQLGSQSARGQALVNGILRDPNNLETACQGFFDVLRNDGTVAGYRRR